METRIDETLQQRGAAYGDFSVGSKAYADILEALDAIHLDATGDNISWRELVPISYIVMKLIRLGATPTHIDSWHDIQGYAKLAETMYKEKKHVTQNEI